MKLYEQIESSFPIILNLFTEEDLLEFKNTLTSDLYLYHFGFGIWIRNNLLYNKKSRLYSLFLESGIDHPDDMSFLIITLFHFYISKKI